MANRGQWLRNKQTHDQRAWPELKKAPMAKPDVDTLWVGPFVADLRGQHAAGSVIFLTTPVVAQLGDTPERREEKLRKLCKMGVLAMGVDRNLDGSFRNFYWKLEDC